MREKLKINSKKGLLELLAFIPLIFIGLFVIVVVIGYTVILAYFSMIDDMYGLYQPEEATIEYSLLPTVLEYNTTYIGDDFFSEYGFVKPEEAVIYYNDKRFDDIENYRGGKEKNANGYVDGLAGYSFISDNKEDALRRGEEDYTQISVKTDMRFHEYSDLKPYEYEHYGDNSYFVNEDYGFTREYVINTNRCMVFVTICRSYFDEPPATSIEEDDEYFENIITRLMDSFYTVSQEYSESFSGDLNG